MKIGIGSDHRGMELRDTLTKVFGKKGYSIINYGPTKIDWDDDYPDYAFKIGKAIHNKEIDFGILICRTGIGMSMACNKVSGVRCAKVNTIKESRLTRMDNDANVIAVGYDMSLDKIQKVIETFLTTEFAGGRHSRRVQKIDEYKNKWE